MELASSAVAALIALLATVLGFRLQERSAARRDGLTQHVQQRQELRQVFVRFLARLAAMRRLQNARSVLREASASEAEQAAAKAAALEARTAVGEALTELQLLTDDVRVLELADRIVDVTFNLHEASDRADRDRRPGRAQHLRRRCGPPRTGLIRAGSRRTPAIFELDSNNFPIGLKD